MDSPTKTLEPGEDIYLLQTVKKPKNKTRTQVMIIILFIVIFLCIVTGVLIYVIIYLLETKNLPTDPLERAKALCNQVPLIDMHNDLPMYMRDVFKKTGKMHNLTIRFSKEMEEEYKKFGIGKAHTDIPRLLDGYLGTQFWVAYVSCNSKSPVEETLGQIDIIKNLAHDYSIFEFATTSNDILTQYEDWKIPSLIGIEGGHSLGVGDEDVLLYRLRDFHRAGVRYLTLTHNCHTDWAESCCDSREPKQKGLSEFGKKLVLEMNKLGIMVDISHTSVNTMIDVLNVSKAPVIFSHSNAYALCNSSRNVPDDVLELLKKNNGVICVAYVPTFTGEEERLADEEITRQFPNNRTKQIEEMTKWREANPMKRANITHVLDHIDYLKNKIGIDHIGIGADFDGITFTVKGLEDVSKHIDVIAGLIERNYTDDEIKKILGLNVLRVMKDVEKLSQS